eukprot:gb/GEZN01003598.1/.p1 GENE.gb/GEZN01003598.1/~~gb/GEZN01003598.1/.p1  ORF type:complete len:461 (+),score=14.19 gb/GEZN01003598.1/:45-1427(+)
MPFNESSSIPDQRFSSRGVVPNKYYVLPMASKRKLPAETPWSPSDKTRNLGVELLMAVAHSMPRKGCNRTESDDESSDAQSHYEQPQEESVRWYSKLHATTGVEMDQRKRQRVEPYPTEHHLMLHEESPVLVERRVELGGHVLPAHETLSPVVSLRTAVKPSPSFVARTSEENPTSNKPFPCKFCDASFMSELQRSKHHNAHNKGRLSHVCSQCHVAVSNLNIHMRIHTNTRPFQCPHCDQAFTVSGSLNRHLRTHSGARPYKCPDCPKACSSSSDLKKHLRIHSGERPYKCNLCPKAFTVSGSLKNHLRTHTGERPYQCSQCYQSFTRSGDLKNHVRIHTGDRPYKCTLCPKAFSVSGSLKNHMRTHTGERPYCCSGCTKSFTTSSDLKKHKRSQHCITGDCNTSGTESTPHSPRSPVSEAPTTPNSPTMDGDESFAHTETELEPLVLTNKIKVEHLWA